MTTIHQLDQIPGQPVLTAYFFDAVPHPHPFWHHYILSLISLGDYPNFPPAQKTFDAATHELLLIALDPQANPMPDNPYTLVRLEPINYAKQFAATNSQAIEVARLLSLALQNGQFLFETSGVQGGKAYNDRFVDTLVKEIANGK